MRTLQKRALPLLVGLVVLSATADAWGRQWQLAGGVFKIDGELVSYDSKQIRVRQPSGLVVPIPLDKLGPADQQYLKTTYPNGLQEAKSEEDKPADAPGTPPAGAPAPPAAPGIPMPATPAPAGPTAPAVAATPTGGATPTAGAPASGTPAPAAAPLPDGITIEVVSLTVTKPPKNGAGDGFVTPGTHVRLLVTNPARTIVGLDPAKSRITECVDDARSNLMGGGDGFGPAELKLDVGPDGHSGTIDVSQPGVPKAQARRIRIRGELHLLCGEAGAELVRVPLEAVFSVGL